jgi:hypothetical protein
MPDIGGESFALQSTMPQGMAGYARFKVERESNRRTVLGPLEESTAELRAAPARSAFYFIDDLIRGDECNGCAHHYQLVLYRWHASTGAFVAEPGYVTARRYLPGGDRGGLRAVPTTFEGARRLDSEFGFRGSSFGSPRPEVPKLQLESEFPEHDEKCYVRPDESLEFSGTKAAKIRYCYRGDRFHSVQLVFGSRAEGLAALSELEMSYGPGIKSDAGRRVDWLGHRAFMAYIEEGEWNSIWIARIESSKSKPDTTRNR